MFSLKWPNVLVRDPLVIDNSGMSVDQLADLHSVSTSMPRSTPCRLALVSFNSMSNNSKTFRSFESKFVRKNLGHTMVSAIKASSVTL